MNFPAESMKIVNGGRPCVDSATVKDYGLNYCSRVICAAKGYVPEIKDNQEKDVGHSSKLLIKMDGSTSYDVPYMMSTTWRQLKITLQVDICFCSKSRNLHISILWILLFY